jgi:hypothetical protein
MIRLRRAILRALEHRWLGPAIMVLLVVMLVFVMLHTTVDTAHHEVGLACLAIVAVILRILVRPAPQVERTRHRIEPHRRGPPVSRLSAAPVSLSRANAPPLRL